MTAPHPHWSQLLAYALIAAVFIPGLIVNVRGVLRAERGE